ncbi:MAG: Snf7 family protein [Candidatus Bathyarchaeota archaeon]|nr:MAG: Snf7 family protein [Candidatus Bathyarchaeota archaeon]
MSERFARKWESKREETSFVDSLRGAVKQPPPLKPRMDYAIKRLDLQIHKLDKTAERFSQKDKALFGKIVDAYAKHDNAHANIYAKELAEVRKMEKIVMNSKLALDQVLLRLQTVTEFGDIVATLGPAIGVLRSVKGGLVGVLPEAENELGDISNMLSGLMFDVGQSSGLSLNFNSVNEDAAKILAEAATVAEQKISANLPELPSGLSVSLARGKGTN